MIISLRYKTQFFQYIIRALSIASKLSLRIDAAGILCAQFLIYTEKDKPSLVEYFVILLKNLCRYCSFYSHIFSSDQMKSYANMEKIYNQAMPL